MFRIKSTLAASVASCALFVSSSFAGELVFNTDASDAAPKDCGVQKFFVLVFFWVVMVGEI